MNKPYSEWGVPDLALHYHFRERDGQGDRDRERERRKHGCVHFLGLINGLVHRVSEDRMTKGCMEGYGFSVFSSDSTGYALFENYFLLFCFPFALLKPSFKFFGFAMLIYLLLHNFLVFASHPSVGRFFSHLLVPYVFLGTNLSNIWLCDDPCR